MTPNDPVLEIWTLGSLAVHALGEPIAPTRTRKSLWLLAFLSLHHGRQVDREALAECLWPDSPPDVARDNLRYALRDLRHVLGEANVALISAPHSLSLDRHLCRSDIGVFDEGIRLAANPEMLRTALTLYRGPFLMGCRESWAEAARIERQTRYLEGVERLSGALTTREAVTLLRTALAYDPLQETLIRSLMLALMRQGRYAEAAQTYHDFRARLPWGQTPSPETAAIYDQIPRQRPAAAPHSGTARFETPGGVLPPEAKAYIERPGHTAVLEAIDRGERIVRLKGSRQSGKSSLLVRAIDRARCNGARVRYTDIATLADAELATIDGLVDALIRSLAVEAPPAPLPPLSRLERSLLRDLEADEGRFLWAIDGIDRLFQLPYHDQIFSKIRAWHNQAAIDPQGPFARLMVALAYSTEAKRFIADEDRSPFNVGALCELHDLTMDQQRALNDRLGGPLRTPDAWERFRRLVGGHPYLTHLGLYALADSHDLTLLEGATADWEFNPFRANLRPLRRDVEGSPLLAESVRRLLRGDRANLTDDDLFRLAIAGIVVGDTAGTAHIRCGLYEGFLRRLVDP